jgi:3-oxoacyl-[acyl-carrier protein] reductase
MAAITPLQGKTAIITGGSKGIGAATTFHLANLGANVVFTYSSDAAAAEALATKINSLFPSNANSPPRVLGFKGDASSIPDLEALVAKTLETYSHIDILVNNAAILRLQDLKDTSEATFDSTMALNVKGPFFLTKLVAPHLAPGSHIIFTSTSLTATSVITSDYLLYVTTKGAIEQMVRVLSKDLAKVGVCVNAVAPGPIGTEMFYNGKSEAVLDAINKLIPMGRVGTPEEVAEVSGWLAGDGSRWVTGQIIRANGGLA